MRSPELAASGNAHVSPLVLKELREALSGRALWTMVLILCPLLAGWVVVPMQYHAFQERIPSTVSTSVEVREVTDDE